MISVDFQAKNSLEASILLMTAVGNVKLESGKLDDVKVVKASL